jgi:hypothetical protein
MTWTHLHERMALMASPIEWSTESSGAETNLNDNRPDVERFFALAGDQRDRF